MLKIKLHIYFCYSFCFIREKYFPMIPMGSSFPGLKRTPEKKDLIFLLIGVLKVESGVFAQIKTKG